MHVSKIKRRVRGMWQLKSLINLDQYDKDAFEITYGLEIIRIKVVYADDLCCQDSFGNSCENNIYHICLLMTF